MVLAYFYKQSGSEVKVYCYLKSDLLQ